QDERLGDDDHAQRGGELRGVREVRRGEERGAREDADDEQHRDRGNEGELADRAEQNALHRPPHDLDVLERSVGHAASRPSAAEMSSSRSHGGSSSSRTTAPRRTTSTRVQIRSSSRSSDTSSTAAPSSRARSRTPSNASFEATSTPTVGPRTTSTDGSATSARPTTTFCWLPPLSSESNWSPPLETIWSRAVIASAIERRWLPEMSPKCESRSRTDKVRFSSTPSVGTKPRACRSSGT